jgi:2-keto-4-pentenoate hydratase/2-oxohepta-3-ene-1,7-dioic acid hydratase in catechol pathway
MKLATYWRDGSERFGALVREGVVELSSDRFPTLRSALAANALNSLAEQVANAEVISVEGLVWRKPITDPGKIICVGLNYKDHAAEAAAEVPANPSLFVRFNDAQVAHEEDIVRPTVSRQFDYEGELAAVIGREARHVSAERALDYVAGYSCFAENSLRDFQSHSRQATAGKNFEQSGAFGPCLVTADEIPDPAKLTLTTRLNGLEVQRASTADLIFPVPLLISYISSFTRLLPGDVIATGTPKGVGSARKPQLWMKPGDVLEVEISGIGVLRNRVVDEVAEAS